jgi:propionate CoA-transferase
LRVVSFEEAVSYIHDGDTIMIGGSGGGHAVPEKLITSVRDRFDSEGSPQDVTLFHPVGLGDMATQGVGHLARSGLLKRIITGALVNTPAIQKMAIEDKVEAYTLPQGVLSQLTREMAAGRPGLISHVGLHTFVDPRLSGGRQSPSAKDDLVELIELEGKEWLFYKSIKVDVAFLRGTTADEDGNITMEKEAVLGEMLSMAQAAHNQGGIVIVQVERLAERNSLPVNEIKIPGMLVDLVVVDPEQMQSYTTQYNPAFSAEIKVPLDEIPPLEFDVRKVIARRAAMEIFPGAICNLGAGVSTGIANIAAEEGFLDQIVLTNEQGLIGGAPASGVDAGAAMNYTSRVEQPYQFDFYDGGGIDLAFLSFAQVDQAGSVNVSRFGQKVIGIGGFQNIAQNAKKVIFSGTFTAGGLKLSWPGGHTEILVEGKLSKFVTGLQQVSYNGRFAAELGQKILFVTERAVFKPVDGVLQIIEIAPGIDLDKDVLAYINFDVDVGEKLVEMDNRLFLPEKMGLGEDIKGKIQENFPARLREE